MAAAESEVDPAVLAKFAQKLAGNEKKFRDRAVKKLRKWMGFRSQQKNGGFTEFDFLKIWKGLHYCMWMSDKPLVQEELATTLSELVHCFNDPKSTVQFISAFFVTESREWFNIDRLRLDKFMMLIRKFLRQTFVFLDKREWKQKLVSQVLTALSASVLSAQQSEAPEGLKLHVADVFIDELIAAGAEKLEKERISQLLDPYCIFITRTKSQPAVKRVIKEVFFQLIDMELERHAEQEEGEEEEGEIDEDDQDNEDDDGDEDDKEENDKDDEEDDEEEEVKDSEEEDDEKEVKNSEEEDEEEEEEEDSDEEESAILNVDYKHLADRLFTLASATECPAKNRKGIYSLVKTFRNLAEGILPEVKELDDEPAGERMNYDKAIQRLNNFEQNLMKKTGKGQREKRKKSQAESENEPEAPPVKKKRLNVEESMRNGEATSEEVESAESGKKKKKKNKVHEINPAKKAMLEKKKKKKVESVEETGDTETVVVLNNPDGGAKTVEKDRESIDMASLRREMLTSTQSPEKNLFEGGFFDSDEEESPKAKKTKKKKKKKSLENTTISEDESCLKENSENELEESGKKKKKKQHPTEEEEVPVLNEVVPNVKGTKKKKKKANGNAMEEAEPVHEDTNGDVNNVSSQKKRKKKSIGNSSLLEASVNGNGTDLESSKVVTPKTKKLKKAKQKSPTDVAQDVLEDGEVEIFVPNKKYKGQFKGAFEKEMKKSLGKGKSPQAKNDFVNFESGTKTPPAFVRRVLTKLKTPKTEPKKKSQKELLNQKADSVPDKKRRVSFVLERNMAQDFEDSLTLSPVVPFDPENLPDRTILKAKKVKECKKLFQRSKAADFF